MKLCTHEICHITTSHRSPTEHHCVVEEVYLGVLQTHPLVEPLRNQPLHHAPQVGRVVEPEGQPRRAGEGEEGEECGDGVGSSPRPTQTVQEDRASEGGTGRV